MTRSDLKKAHQELTEEITKGSHYMSQPKLICFNGVPQHQHDALKWELDSLKRKAACLLMAVSRVGIARDEKGRIVSLR